MKFLSRALPLILLAGVALADTGTEPRQSLTNDTYNEHEPLELREAMAVNKDESTRQRSASFGLPPDSNFWFYDVFVDLFSDFDRDGYLYYSITKAFTAFQGLRSLVVLFCW